MSSQDSMTGRVLGNRYEIRDRIGVGGMAEVYRAQDTVLGRIVAIKVMLPQYASDSDFTQRFRQEAAAAANLASPYIVNVYDWGQDKGTYFIVMEFVRGSDLKTAIQQRGAVNQRKVAEIASQACQALSVAHNQDIIHRDIKPQNIMVQPDGNVKVMDFGIARAKNSVKEKTSAVLGTAHYISPEQAQGKELTAASDIYSLGVVMYEATTGQLPFDGPDAVTVALQQVKDQPQPPQEINPNLDPALQAIIMCAMAKNPRDRFATTNDMRMALNDYLAGRPVNLPGQPSITSAETQIIGGAAPAQTAMMPAQNPYAATQKIVPPSGPSKTVAPANYRSQPPKKSKTPLVIGIIVAAIAVAAIVVGAIFALGNPGNLVRVPSVTGMTVEEATVALEGEGFEVGTVNSTYDPTVEEGHIVSQDPAANSEQKPGTRVNLIVSQGEEMITVPDLTDKTVEEAKQLAERYGFTLDAEPGSYSATIAQNHIISQDPVAGTQIPKGSAVKYVISLGVEMVDVPNVLNYPRDEALSTLEERGLDVTILGYQYSSSYEAGTVMAQSPSSGRVEKGSTVSITISNGPEPAPEPTPTPEPDTGNTGGDEGGDTGGDDTTTPGDGEAAANEV